MNKFVLLLLTSALVGVESQTKNRGTYNYEFRSGHARISDHNAKITQNQQYLNGNLKTEQSLNKRPGGVPPYAVLMEPLVHYSQPDPLYGQEKLNVSDGLKDAKNDLIAKNYVNDESKDKGIAQNQVVQKQGTGSSQEDSATSAGNIVKWITPNQIIHVRPYRKPKPKPTPPPEAPEPIIEIIIKESNISLPGPPPPPPPPPKKKEPVHVFFVKYSKDENAGYGEEEKLIYEAPIPAVTPPTNNGDPNEDLQNNQNGNGNGNGYHNGNGNGNGYGNGNGNGWDNGNGNGNGNGYSNGNGNGWDNGNGNGNGYSNGNGNGWANGNGNGNGNGYSNGNGNGWANGNGNGNGNGYSNGNGNGYSNGNGNGWANGNGNGNGNGYSNGNGNGWANGNGNGNGNGYSNGNGNGNGYGEGFDIATYRPPSTTLKAIIKPESEIYTGTGGLQITFGGPGSEPDDNAGYPSTHHKDYHKPSDTQSSVKLTHKSSAISRASTDSQPTKRNPEPFHAAAQQALQSSPRPTISPFVSSQEFQKQTPLPTYQQAPQFPAQTFQKSLQSFSHQVQSSVNVPKPTQPYSTLPQNLLQNAPGHHHFGASRSPPVQATAQSAQQYHTINDHHLRQQFQNNARPTSPQQYHTINHPTLQSNNFRSVSGSTNGNRFPQVNNVTPSNPFGQRNRPQVNLLEHHNRPQQTQFANYQQQPHFNNHFQQQLRQQPSQQQQQQQQQRPQQNFQTDSAPEIIKSISPDIATLAREAQKAATQRPSFQTSRTHFQTSKASFPSTSSSPVIKFSTQRVNSHTSKPIITYKSTTSTKIIAQTTPPPIEYVTEDPRKLEEERRRKEEKRKQNIAALPKEVPADLREQLLSSGILGNADIQILDYDKIGDIPIESLPPEALANFRQVAGSAPVPSVVRPEKQAEDIVSSASENQEVVVAPAPSKNSAELMEMKVVRFNPESQEGVSVAQNYMKEGATQLDPVVLNDSKYNRYLPLKVAGAQFPVPDVPELRGRNVTSVVVLAPVDYEFLQRKENDEDSISRSASPVLEVQGVHFIAGDTLKTLVKLPTTENYKRWLDKENNTSPDKQSVVLLVLEPLNNSPSETKDIFMFDISTQRVSKLKGELSSTFVEVAESNSQNEDLEEISDSPSAPGGDFTISDTSGLPPSVRRIQRKAKASPDKPLPRDSSR